MLPKGSGSTFSKWCTSPRGPLCDSISCKWECSMTMSDTSLRWRTAPRLYQQQRKESSFPQGWSSRNCDGVCPNIVAEPVQPQPLNSSGVDSYITTGPRGYWACHVWEKNKKLKAIGKASTAWLKAKSNPKCKASGGPTGQVPKKCHSEKLCQRCKAHSGPYQTHNTLLASQNQKRVVFN